MYFINIGETASQIVKADAIACKFFAPLTKRQEVYWEFFLFVVNSDRAKEADFWIENECNLAEAIRKEKYSIKADKQLTEADRFCLENTKELQRRK
ncbi:hypothetical protein [Pseudanabaena sp. 'Roaring Creek']|uniref:hypothetical protein n=1 Tax=Pseudanabaena sp. 'Roaring Creek' TaxID=1681830 RepID=UPI0006D7CEB5|nr:hypothetical protein [Pseudanabaena sp. 'Roaring Creek']